MLITSKSGGATTAVHESGLTQSRSLLAVLEHSGDGSGSVKGAPARGRRAGPPPLHHRVAGGDLPEVRRAQLRRSLLRLEVHVHDPEPVAVSLAPLEVVHQTPLEVALDRHAFGG